MKKIYLMLMIALMTSFFSCGGAEVKSDDKKEENKEVKNEEPKEKKADIVPEIDVESLKDANAFVEAMQKVKDARRMDDSLKDADKNYKGNFVKLLKLETAVRKKSTEFAKTMASKEAVEFLKKISDIK
jgi:hypothetical protein